MDVFAPISGALGFLDFLAYIVIFGGAAIIGLMLLAFIADTLSKLFRKKPE